MCACVPVSMSTGGLGGASTVGGGLGGAWAAGGGLGDVC